ncbi:MAG: hypothetical protein OIN89_01320 [Candidatus Methanoperedens sp.]|jgi:predicted small secreted protein|nr:hypothetical protein [Candidatus Methanoperedens sp.]PKL54534.1 MAG: hypothetical protein CVV36_01295 [Candidatus Methanoperedenaceae archaeon HGW-Methanoperedenaceae-1]
MSNKILLIAVLLVTAVFLSGCIFDKDNGTGADTGIIPDAKLPDGFTFLGSHDANVEVGNTTLPATEDVYRNSNSEDIYVQVIESDNPGGLITRFKLKYKDANYEPFKDIWFNGHIATQVKDYITLNGKQEARYVVIWATETSMMIVGSSAAEKDVLDMAIATGS